MYLPEMSEEDRKRIYNDFEFAISFPAGSMEREGIILAYVDVMKGLTMTATLAALPMMVLVLFMKELKLERGIANPSLHNERESHQPGAISDR